MDLPPRPREYRRRERPSRAALGPPKPHHSQNGGFGRPASRPGRSRNLHPPGHSGHRAAGYRTAELSDSPRPASGMPRCAGPPRRGLLRPPASAARAGVRGKGRERFGRAIYSASAAISSRPRRRPAQRCARTHRLRQNPPFGCLRIRSAALFILATAARRQGSQVRRWLTAAFERAFSP